MVATLWLITATPRLHGEFGHEIVGPEIEINDIVAHFPDLLTPEAVGGRIFAAA